jgi:hypothetical protein
MRAGSSAAALARPLSAAARTVATNACARAPARARERPSTEGRCLPAGERGQRAKQHAPCCSGRGGRWWRRCSLCARAKPRTCCSKADTAREGARAASPAEGMSRGRARAPRARRPAPAAGTAWASCARGCRARRPRWRASCPRRRAVARPAGRPRRAVRRTAPRCGSLRARARAPCMMRQSEGMMMRAKLPAGHLAICTVQLERRRELQRKIAASGRPCAAGRPWLCMLRGVAGSSPPVPSGGRENPTLPYVMGCDRLGLAGPGGARALALPMAKQANLRVARSGSRQRAISGSSRSAAARRS